MDTKVFDKVQEPKKQDQDNRDDLMKRQTDKIMDYLF